MCIGTRRKTSCARIRQGSFCAGLLLCSAIQAQNADEGFNVVVDGSVYCAVAQRDGKILIAGDFITVNGASRPRLARLFVDGSLDTGFPELGIDDLVYSVA